MPMLTVEIQAFQGAAELLPMVSILEYDFPCVDGVTRPMKEVFLTYAKAEETMARYAPMADLYQNLRISNYIIWS